MFDEIKTQSARPILPLPRKKQTARKVAQSTATHDNLFSDSDSHSPNRPGPVSPGPRKQTAVKSTRSTGTHSDLFAGAGEDKDAHKRPAAKRLRTSASGARANSSAESEDLWDVRGSYVIECPDIEEEWGEKDSDLTLDIYVENKNGRHQMFAMFNFIVVEVWFQYILVPGVH